MILLKGVDELKGKPSRISTRLKSKDESLQGMATRNSRCMHIQTKLVAKITKGV